MNPTQAYIKIRPAFLSHSLSHSLQSKMDPSISLCLDEIAEFMAEEGFFLSTPGPGHLSF